MNSTVKNICAAGIMTLCALPALAQLSGSGYYRIRNAAATGDYIALANDKFNYNTCINVACGGLHNAMDSDGQNRAMVCAGRYLETDIHMVNEQVTTLPGAVIYADKYNNNPNNYNYNLIGQGTSLLTLTTGYYYHRFLPLEFYDNYIAIKAVSGSGATTLYTASIVLKAQNNSLANLGTRYFVDDNGTFAINTSSSAQNAKWYVEKVECFNVVPEVEFNGKYYTTIKVPYGFKLAGNVDKAYTVTAVDGGVLAYDEIAVTGDSVPGGTPVVLECSSPNAADCQLIPVGTPICTAPDKTKQNDAPATDEAITRYNGINLLAGTYYCNLDGTKTYPTSDDSDGAESGSFNANHITPTSGKFVLGITQDGKLGFVPATGTAMPANKAWLTVAAQFPWELPVVQGKGDVNHDGKVDVDDVSATINQVLGKLAADEPFDSNEADLNGDGAIDVDDVSALINLVLGKQ